MRQQRQFRKQCVSVFGWLEWSSTTGEFSNFQNAGRNVYKEVAIMWKNKESYVDSGGVFGFSIIKHITLQKTVAHDFRYYPRSLSLPLLIIIGTVLVTLTCTLLQQHMRMIQHCLIQSYSSTGRLEYPLFQCVELLSPN